MSINLGIVRIVQFLTLSPIYLGNEAYARGTDSITKQEISMDVMFLR